MITQHMPPGFTKSYAARLDGLCRIAVAEARDGERVLPGHAYIAPGGHHLSVERSGANYIARVQDGEPVNRHKPSVEVLFESAARVVGRNALGVMLTGMGADGAKAMKTMKDAGSWNLVQDEASCVVFGMPREAIAHGPDRMLPAGRRGRSVLVGVHLASACRTLLTFARPPSAGETGPEGCASRVAAKLRAGAEDGPATPHHFNDGFHACQMSPPPAATAGRTYPAASATKSPAPGPRKHRA